MVIKIKYVIYPLISEEDILLLDSVGMLERLEKCSTKRVVMLISSYLEDKEKDNNPEVVELVKNIWSEKLNLYAVLSDEETKDSVTKVQGIRFDSVHAGLDLDTLNEMKETILAVVDNKYSVPYVAPIPPILIDGIINDLNALGRNTGKRSYSLLAAHLDMSSNLFSDSRFKHSEGTVFKNVAKRSGELDIILRGIDFLINMKTIGKSPQSWRVF